MTRIFTTVAAAALMSAATVAAAQTGSEPTGSGASASTTAGAADRTGSITGVGQTKPPGSPVGEKAGTTPELERKSHEIDRMIERGICKGC